MGATVEGDVVTVRGHDTSRVNAVIDAARGAALMIESVEPHRFSLEDLLVEAMGGPGTARAIPGAKQQFPGSTRAAN